MALELRKAARIALLIAAAPALWSSAAAALGFNDVYGRWCTGGGETEFTQRYLKILRYSDNVRADFPITRYEFSNAEVRVHWVQADGSHVSTTYGHFSRDGLTMVQLPTREAGERPFTRC